MSKIERALRKAEEDSQKQSSIFPSRPKATEDGVPPYSEFDMSALQAPFMELSEWFRKIVARMKVCCETMGVNDILFTSAVSEEGKTTAAVNCAISLAQDFNHSVCLVDCDLRNPRLSELFESHNGPALTDVLKGRWDAASSIQATSMQNLSIVHAHRVGRYALPLLSSDRLNSLIRELRAGFDFVILDSPPVLPVADAVVLSKAISSVALVIEPGRTRRKHVEQILEQIDRSKIVGFIMNYKRYRIPQPYNYKKYYSYRINADAQLAFEKE